MLCVDKPVVSSEWAEKQLHHVPDAPTVDRADYLVEQARGKVILDIGASGRLVRRLQQVAGGYHGLDKRPNDDIERFFQVDLDRARELPSIPALDLIIAGEVMEHLSNAGHFLDLIHACGVPAILTTPNAFSRRNEPHLLRGVEYVNKEHTCWYSYHTLKVLIERHNFRVIEWRWYDGPPIFANGLIFYIEAI